MNYYEKLGKGHDDLLRCKDCQRLVTMKDVTERGTCICGNRRVMQITTLSTWEWLKIKLGLIQFDHSKEFLAEFSSKKRKIEMPEPEPVRESER